MIFNLFTEQLPKANKLVLYAPFDNCYPITGGWVKNQDYWGSITQDGNGYMVIKGLSGGQLGVEAVSVNQIDISKYKTIVVVATSVVAGSNSKVLFENCPYATFEGVLEVGENRFDISSLTFTRKVRLSTYSDKPLVISDVWLE